MRIDNHNVFFCVYLAAVGVCGHVVLLFPASPSTPGGAWTDGMEVPARAMPKSMEKPSPGMSISWDRDHLPIPPLRRHRRQLVRLRSGERNLSHSASEAKTESAPETLPEHRRRRRERDNAGEDADFTGLLSSHLQGTVNSF